MKLDIVAFGAHPDDVELFAGGTLAKMAAQGYATGIVDMTRGELGSRGTAKIRANEAREAARILKVKVRENLRLPDGEVTVTSRARLEVIKILRKYRPVLVLAHHWDDRHPDHTHTSRLVMEAAHHAGLAKIRTGQERHRPTAVLYYKLPYYIFPSFIVDISEHANDKMAAVAAYQSQLFDPSSLEPATYLSKPEFLQTVDTLHAYYGNLIGRSRGEAFFTRGICEIPDPLSFFKSQQGSHFR